MQKLSPGESPASHWDHTAEVQKQHFASSDQRLTMTLALGSRSMWRRYSYLRRCRTRNAIQAAPPSTSTPTIPMLVNRKSTPSILDVREYLWWAYRFDGTGLAARRCAASGTTAEACPAAITTRRISHSQPTIRTALAPSTNRAPKLFGHHRWSAAVGGFLVELVAECSDG